MYKGKITLCQVPDFIVVHKRGNRSTGTKNFEVFICIQFSDCYVSLCQKVETLNGTAVDKLQ